MKKPLVYMVVGGFDGEGVWLESARLFSDESTASDYHKLLTLSYIAGGGGFHFAEIRELEVQ